MLEAHTIAHGSPEVTAAPDVEMDHSSTESVQEDVQQPEPAKPTKDVKQPKDFTKVRKVEQPAYDNDVSSGVYARGSNGESVRTNCCLCTAPQATTQDFRPKAADGRAYGYHDRAIR